MDRQLRARHARTWLFLGPALIAATIALLLLRPRVEPAMAPQDSSGASSGATP